MQHCKTDNDNLPPPCAVNAEFNLWLLLTVYQLFTLLDSRQLTLNTCIKYLNQPVKTYLKKKTKNNSQALSLKHKTVHCFLVCYLEWSACSPSSEMSILIESFPLNTVVAIADKVLKAHGKQCKNWHDVFIGWRGQKSRWVALKKFGYNWAAEQDKNQAKFLSLVSQSKLELYL